MCAVLCVLCDACRVTCDGERGDKNHRKKKVQGTGSKNGNKGPEGEERKDDIKKKCN